MTWEDGDILVGILMKYMAQEEINPTSEGNVNDGRPQDL